MTSADQVALADTNVAIVPAMRRGSSVIGAIAMALALLSALVTFLVLTGLTSIVPTHEVVVTVLLVNAVTVLILLGVIIREVWHALLEKLADTFSRYAVAQGAAGADAVQVFDSWVGALSPADYEEFVAPWSGRVLAALRDAGVPSIHFGTGTGTLLPAMAAAGGDVIGLDWRIPLDEGWKRAGRDRAVQGNLDPAVLLAPWDRIEAAVRDVLARAAGRPGHIFNLGHGVLPSTDPAVLGRLRELVHAETAQPRP